MFMTLWDALRSMYNTVGDSEDWTAHVARRLLDLVQPRSGVEVRFCVLGGGRIEAGGARRAVFGYSKTFGRCKSCNEVAADLLSENCSACEVTWSNDGY